MLNEQYFHVTTTTITSFQAFEAVQLRIQFFWDFATHHWMFVSQCFETVQRIASSSRFSCTVKNAGIGGSVKYTW
jgi:hypothetical protein